MSGIKKLDHFKLANLLKLLGEERFQALISTRHMGKVRDFCDELLLIDGNLDLTNVGPEKLNYDILSFLRSGEEYVDGYAMVTRAIKMNAHLEEDEGQYLLENQQDIPASLRGKVRLVFTNWRHPKDMEGVYCLLWNGDCWVKGWYSLESSWHDSDRLLRPK